MRKRLLCLLALLLGFALMLAAAPAPEEPAGDQEEALPEATIPLKIPDKEKQRQNPVKNDPESTRHGEELYVTQCAMCHGASGDGKGDLVDRLNLKVPDFTDPAVQKQRTDGELFYILTFGHGDMPGEGERLPEEWKWDLVNYIRSF